MEEGVKKPEKKGAGQVILNILGIVLCVLFVPIIIINVIMIVRSYTDPDHIPSVFGYSPVIVLSGSMSPEFEAGDMILLQKTDPYTLKVGDVVCYLEEETAVTHRIIEIQQQDGYPLYITQGDANNTEDSSPVGPDQIQGKYTGVYITGAGNFAMFLQSTPGMLIFIGGPVLLFILWDVLRRVLDNRRAKKEKGQLEAAATDKQQELEAMEQELQRLRAQVGNTSASAPVPQPPQPPQQTPPDNGPDQWQM